MHSIIADSIRRAARIGAADIPHFAAMCRRFARLRETGGRLPPADAVAFRKHTQRLTRATKSLESARQRWDGTSRGRRSYHRAVDRWHDAVSEACFTADSDTLRAVAAELDV